MDTQNIATDMTFLSKWENPRNDFLWNLEHPKARAFLVAMWHMDIEMMELGLIELNI